MKRSKRIPLVVVALLGIAVVAVPAIGAAKTGHLVSQRQWMRAHGVNPGEWVSRFGGAVGSLTRTSAREVPGGTGPRPLRRTRTASRPATRRP